MPRLSVIMTHENADFDAISALMAAARLYPGAIPVLPRHINRNVSHFLTLYGADLPLVDAEDVPRGRIECVILVDTQAMVTIRGLADDLEVQIIDHHPLSRELKPGWQYWGEASGAVTTLLVERLIERGLEVSAIEATLFLLGIYEDTGSLSYQTTLSRDVSCVAWLLVHGASLSIANDFLHYPLTEDQKELYELLLNQAQDYTLSGQSIVVTAVSFERYVEEVSVLAHRLRELWEPAGLFLLVHFERSEGEDSQVQLIARSTSEAIDVGAIAAQLGGGGHGRAAAALIRDMSLQEAKARLLALLEEHIQPTVRVREIMSYGVRMVDPGMTVARAAELMQRYGHEGFPVVEEGRVVGMISRREVDRAMRLGLEQAAVSTYMTKGQIQVRSEDAVETVQQVMFAHSVGQVPVVSAEGAILGIVTRTDLINLLLRTPNELPHQSRQEIARKLHKMLDAYKLGLLQQAADLAQKLGYRLYVVGGFVRDLVLERGNLDIDLVVEGDAIELARKLARQVGGRVRAHTRFGTAKWILNGHESLDFVTARTEFYTHPTALPEVESSSIKQDLYRRDFTINTLAIRLDGEHYGELLDFYGGLTDLKSGVIRVLHSLSFVEDPTRILRAIRLEQRLGFVIEPRTRELITNALALLAQRVSGERVRHELFLLLQEPEPEAGLTRMEELDVLHQIHPQLRSDSWLREKFATLREALPQWYEPGWRLTSLPEEDDALDGMAIPRDNLYRLYLALLAYRLSPAELEILCTRLRLPRDDEELLREVAALRDEVAHLQAEHVRPSEVVHLLAPYSGPALLVTWVAVGSPVVCAYLSRYRDEYRHVKPTLTGDDLKAMGFRPGPLFGTVLGALRDARLDGQIVSEAEERDLARAMLEAGSAPQ